MLDVYYQNLLNYIDRRLENLGNREKLMVAGDLYLEVAKIIEEKANLSLDEWKLKYDPNYSDYLPGLFDSLLINKSNSLNIGGLLLNENLEEKELLEDNKPIQLPKIRKNKQVSLSEIINLSHAEDIETWSKLLAELLGSRSMTLAQILRQADLSPGAVIYSLLLGGFEIEQKGDFYDNNSIVVFRGN